MAATIRLAQPSDAAAIAAIYAPFCERTTVSFEYAAPSTDDIARRINAVTEQFPWLVLENDEQIAGYAYAGAHRERAAYMWAVDVAVYVDPTHHGRGIGRALYTTLLQVLPLQNYFRAYAGVALPNAASVALHTAMGFTPVGVYHDVGYKFGQWHDVQWYERALQPLQTGPSLPRSVHTITGTADWDQAVQAGLTAYRGTKEHV